MRFVKDKFSRVISRLQKSTRKWFKYFWWFI